MRLKFLFTLLLLALVIIGAAVFLKQHFGTVSTPAPVSPEIATAPPDVAKAEANVVLPPLAPPPAAPVAATPEQRQAAIDAETDKLQQLSANDDQASLDAILGDLTSPEKEIREAAIEAAKQFGSTNAIPALKAAAESDPDPDEQAELLDAASFLALPDYVFTPGTGATTTPGQQRPNRQPRPQRQAGQNSPGPQ